MTIMRKFLIAVLAFACAALPASGQAVSADAEKALYELWQAHVAASNDHEQAYAKCREFSAKTYYYPLTMVADGMAVWHLMKSSQWTNALKLAARLETITPSFPLADAASTMGKTWLTRVEREKVRSALKYYYRKNVEFPTALEALESLPPEIKPPSRDRFGKNWSYRIINFKYLRGFKNQKYELFSTTLGDKNSDLTNSLARPYASEIQLKPVTLRSGTPGRETYSFERTGEKKETVLISLGSKNNNILFAFCGQRIIILSDGNHWSVMPRPR